MNAGLGGFILWTIFIYILYYLVNSMVKQTEKFYNIGVHIHIYDYFIFTVLISTYIYGFYAYGGKQNGNF